MIYRSRKWQFFVTGDHWSGYDIECLLRKYGIAITGRRVMADPPCVTFYVERQKANFAEYIMCRAKLTILSTPFNPGNLNHVPKKQGSVLPGGGGGIRRDITTRIIDIITAILGIEVGTAHERHNLSVERRKPDSYPWQIIDDFLN